MKGGIMSKKDLDGLLGAAFFGIVIGLILFLGA